MKLQNIHLGLLLLLLTLFWYLWMPGTLWATEATDFFSFAPEFLRNYRSAPQGIALLLSSFMAQFFKIRFLGALLMALIPVLFIRTQIATLPTGIRNDNAPAAFLPGYLLALLLLGGLPLQTGIQFLLISAITALYAFIERPLGRITLLVSTFALSYSLFPPVLTIVLFVLLWLTERTKPTHTPARITAIGFTLIALLVPVFLHRYIPTLSTSVGFTLPGLDPRHTTLVYMLLGATLLVRVLASKPISIRSHILRLTTHIAPLALFFGWAFTAQDDTTEKGHRMDQALVQKNWEYIEHNFDKSQLDTDARQLRYLALALNQTGQLGNKLFSYPFRSENDFYYPQCLNQPCSFFHTIFYDCLGIKNETIHHAFQNGIASSKGISFLTANQLRHEYAAIGKTRIAERYNRLLAGSTLYGSIELPAGNAPQETKPASTFFVGSRPLLSELAKIVDTNPGNKAAFDYLLCGILLNRDLGKLPLILKYYPLEKGETLPRHYLEALLLMHSSKPEAGYLSNYHVPESYLHEFKEFVALMNQKEIGKITLRNKYSHTFWYHYTNR